MEGELVSSSSEDGEGDGENRDPLVHSYAALFDRVCPLYLMMGMSYAEFWDGDPTLVIPYREAYKLRRKQQNFNLWLQGRYVYDALCAASPLFRFTMKSGEIKAEAYTEAPYPLTEKEAREQREAAERKAYEDNMAAMRQRFAAMRARQTEENEP